MHEHTISQRTFLIVYAALMVLLIVTVAASAVDLGTFNLIVAMAIAVAKAILIILFFMHMIRSSRITWIIAGAGFVWLGILIVLALSDYISRGWLPTAGK